MQLRHEIDIPNRKIVQYDPFGNRREATIESQGFDTLLRVLQAVGFDPWATIQQSNEMTEFVLHCAFATYED
jgi:hypothetical protein